MDTSKQQNDISCATIYLSFDADSTISSAAFKTLEAIDNSLTDSPNGVDINKSNNSHINSTLEPEGDEICVGNDNFEVSTVKKIPKQHVIAVNKPKLKDFHSTNFSSTPTKLQLIGNLNSDERNKRNLEQAFPNMNVEEISTISEEYKENIKPIECTSLECKLSSEELSLLKTINENLDGKRNLEKAFPNMNVEEITTISEECKKNVKPIESTNLECKLSSEELNLLKTINKNSTSKRNLEQAFPNMNEEEFATISEDCKENVKVIESMECKLSSEELSLLKAINENSPKVCEKIQKDLDLVQNEKEPEIKYNYEPPNLVLEDNTKNTLKDKFPTQHAEHKIILPDASGNSKNSAEVKTIKDISEPTLGETLKVSSKLLSNSSIKSKDNNLQKIPEVPQKDVNVNQDLFKKEKRRSKLVFPKIKVVEYKKNSPKKNEGIKENFKNVQQKNSNIGDKIISNKTKVVGKKKLENGLENSKNDLDRDERKPLYLQKDIPKKDEAKDIENCAAKNVKMKLPECKTSKDENKVQVKESFSLKGSLTKRNIPSTTQENSKKDNPITTRYSQNTRQLSVCTKTHDMIKSSNKRVSVHQTKVSAVVSRVSTVESAKNKEVTNPTINKKRTSLYMQASSNERLINYKSRMSTVVKTTLNSPARKFERKSVFAIGAGVKVARKSVLPSTVPDSNFNSRNKSLLVPTEMKTLKENETFTTINKATDAVASGSCHADKAKEKKSSFICSVCSAKFQIKSLFDAHKLSHTPDPQPLPIPKLSINTFASKKGPISSTNKCKYCDKTFALERALHIHLLQNCVKIPSKEKRNLQYTEMDHTEKAQLPAVFHHENHTQPSTTKHKSDIQVNVTSGNAKRFKETCEKPSIKRTNKPTESIANTYIKDAATIVKKSCEKTRMSMPAPAVPSVKKNIGHAGVYRTPNKTICCHKCKQAFSTVLDYINHNMTFHSTSLQTPKGHTDSD